MGFTKVQLKDATIGDVIKGVIFLYVLKGIDKTDIRAIWNASRSKNKNRGKLIYIKNDDVKENK
ncbi:MAG: hypothetical protein ABWY25_03540 [Paenisporosarcina sp.]